MLRSLTTFTTDEFAELLVDLDSIFQGFEEPLWNQAFAKCPTYSENGVKLKEEGVLEGEMGRTSHIYITKNGDLAFRFKSVTPDTDLDAETEVGYDSFDAINLEDQFPEVGKALEAYLLREHGADLRELWRSCKIRYRAKPQMIDLANERINYGRRMRACNLLEKEANERDADYEADDGFGLF